MILRKNSKLIVTFTLFFFFIFQSIKACDCIPQSELNIKDWNDTELVFQGNLKEHTRNFQYGKLVFKITKIYKGQIKNELIFYYKPKQNHNLLHSIKEFKIGEEWIIFGTIERKNGKKYPRLLESKNIHFCALSRPIKKKDPYLKYLTNIVFYKSDFQEFIDKNNKPIAFGFYSKNQPDGTWAYFDSQGRLESKGKYKDGKRVGIWEVFFYNWKNKRKLLKKEVYKNGILIETREYNVKEDLEKVIKNTT